jgi:hypothetical protein
MMLFGVAKASRWKPFVPEEALMRTVKWLLAVTVVAGLIACAQTPQSAVTHQASVLKASPQVRQSQSDLPRVASLDDLLAVTATPLDDQWEVRLGLSDGGELASGWHVIYCLLSYKGEGEASWPEHGQWPGSLGPLKFRVDDPHGEHLRRAQMSRQSRVSDGATSLLFAQIIPTVFAGPYIITLSKSDGSLLRESRLDVLAPGPMLWHAFANEMGDTQVVEGREVQQPRMIRKPMAALPVLASNEPLISLMPDGSQSIGGLGQAQQLDATPESLRGLPGMAPLSVAWQVEWFEGMDMRTKQMSDSLPTAERGTWRLKLTDSRLVIGDDEIFGGLASNLIARWWVNGKPVEVPKFRELHIRSLTFQPHPMGPIPLMLPLSLGELKPGDEVSLQLMYCPERYESTGRRVLRDANDLSLPQLPVTYPQLTDRITFSVTQQMLADRKAMESE